MEECNGLLLLAVRSSQFEVQSLIMALEPGQGKKNKTLLFIPTNAQTYILKYFTSAPTCFSASAPCSGREGDC